MWCRTTARDARLDVASLKPEHATTERRRFPGSKPKIRRQGETLNPLFGMQPLLSHFYPGFSVRTVHFPTGSYNSTVAGSTCGTC